MLMILLLLFALNFINCNKITGKLPLISYERRISSKVIEGNCNTLHISTGNKDLAIGKDRILIKNKEFKFKKNIQGLLVKYLFNYGDCIACGSCSFDQITRYPIIIEIDPITKDSIEILDVNNKTIRYKRNNEISTIIESDSIQFSNDKIDTAFNKYKGNKQRLITAINYKTTLKYMATLNLKTMQYEKNNKKSKIKRKRRGKNPDDSMPVYNPPTEM